MPVQSCSDTDLTLRALSRGLSSAITSSFQVICGEEPVQMADAATSHSERGIVGIISFLGDYALTLFLNLPAETAPALARQFTGLELSYEQPEMGEVVAELVNVLAGKFCAEIEELGIKAQMSLPTVARGGHVELLLPGRMLSEQLGFSSAAGPFSVRVVAAKPHAR